jgi:hypothetical protein
MMAPPTRTSLPRPPRRLSFALAACLLLAGAAPLPAAPAARGPFPSPVLAQEGSRNGAGAVLSSFRTRSGVIRLCIVAMTVGLFILMRKFTDPTGGPRPPQP